MTDDTPQGHPTGPDETILQQQYLRALSSFEGIVLSQIDVKNKLGDRLNYSIRAGLIILSVIAFSILVLLLTLTSQISRISNVVGSMNTHFSEISQRMNEIDTALGSMEREVAGLQSIRDHTLSMQEQMLAISNSTGNIEDSMLGIGEHMTLTRANVERIALTMNAMNGEVQAMSAEMHRMAKPARTLNKMFPFP